jgi:hypothetical protein
VINHSHCHDCIQQIDPTMTPCYNMACYNTVTKNGFNAVYPRNKPCSTECFVTCHHGRPQVVQYTVCRAIEYVQGDQTLQRLIDNENARQEAPFENLHFIKDQMLNRRIKSHCAGGYEVYKSLLCGMLYNDSYLLHMMIVNSNSLNAPICSLDCCKT